MTIGKQIGPEEGKKVETQGIKRAKKLPRVKKSPRGDFWARRGFFSRGFNLWFLRGFCSACLRGLTEGVGVPHFEGVPGQHSAPGQICTTSLQAKCHLHGGGANRCVSCTLEGANLERCRNCC